MNSNEIDSKRGTPPRSDRVLAQPGVPPPSSTPQPGAPGTSFAHQATQLTDAFVHSMSGDEALLAQQRSAAILAAFRTPLRATPTVAPQPLATERSLPPPPPLPDGPGCDEAPTSATWPLQARDL